ncbi:hypothetical protein HRbin30_00942 [bacterium HR30]|nr:hypothetical protein HRbin30_00942 [bacterium HR30]
MRYSRIDAERTRIGGQERDFPPHADLEGTGKNVQCLRKRMRVFWFRVASRLKDEQELRGQLVHRMTTGQKPPFPWRARGGSHAVPTLP